ncbi:hypothetical protein [Actinocrispum sp. NPDC049592]|uniref:hypothetical protein n=1 Tax=Actinocrispum sp. NPDC049592 TaxID=3154835 RepID=UPI003435BF02
MSFFGDLPEPVDDRAEILRARPQRYPGVPTDWIRAVTLPWSRTLGEGAEVLVALDRVRCWPDGVSLDIDVFAKHAIVDVRRMGGLWGHSHGVPRSPGELLLGIRYADGQRVSTVDELPPGTDRLRMSAYGGSGSPFHFRYEFYMSPLPPEGPVSIVVRWLDKDLPETVTDLDGAAIREAAANAVEVWPDLPPA